ncbi:MAG: DUF4340 domain-containing protein [Myxococcales bacterium]|nr:DUF4340 domain-containing protein [Myxococcales bacterium]MCB9708964.1 DUF4340 domain-containing protein [Myxococcales bacterium]
MRKDSRLTIAAVVLAVLVGLTVWALTMRKGELDQDAKPEGSLPHISADNLDELEIERPGASSVIHLKKINGNWLITAPIAAEADTKAVEMAVEKLTDLSVTAIAATKSSSHQILEVDDKQAIRVVAKNKGKVLANLLIGASRGGNTMVRESGKAVVMAVSGSMKWSFNKDLKDWRNRKILEIKPEEISGVTYQSANGTFHLAQKSGSWTLEPPSKAVKRFSSSQASSMISSVASLNASDFADPSITEEQAGLAKKPVATVSLSINRSGKGPEKITIRIGHANPKDENQFYLKADGDIIYLVGKYVKERLTPKVVDFQEPEKKPAEEAPSASPSPGGAPDMNQLPPEVMQQLQQQMGQPH